MAVKNENAKQSCLLGCVITGGLVGLLAMALLYFVGEDYGSAASIFLGGLAGVVVAFLMILLFCRELPKPIDASASNAAEAPKPAAASKPAVAAAPVAAPAPAKKAAPKSAAKKTAPKATKAKAAAAAPGEEGKPAALASARDGKPDNLKEIKGVGPKLEKMLNSMGYFHFDQIAAWKKKDVAWADENLVGFKGRVSRDEWVKQAKILAKGGETEFSKRVDKGDVY